LYSIHSKSNIVDPFTVLESQLLNSARFVARAIINSEDNSIREINIVDETVDETVLIINKLSVV